MSGLLPSAALHSCFWFFSFIGANNLNTSFYTCYTPCGWQIGSLVWDDLSCRNQCTSQTFVFFFLRSFATAVDVVVVNPYPLGRIRRRASIVRLMEHTMSPFPGQLIPFLRFVAVRLTILRDLTYVRTDCTGLTQGYGGQ